MIRFTLLLFFLSGCSSSKIAVFHQKIDKSYPVSYAIDAPDKEALEGEQIFFDWRRPEALEGAKLRVDLVFGDLSRETLFIPLQQRSGTWNYRLIGETFQTKKGLLTYRAEMLDSEGKVYDKWEQQLYFQPLRPKKEKQERISTQRSKGNTLRRECPTNCVNALCVDLVGQPLKKGVKAAAEG